MSFDWGPWKGGSGEFVKFETIGDNVVGKVVAIRMHTFDKEKGPVVLLDLERQGDGERVTLACDKVNLRQQIADIEPQVSDMIAVKFTGEEKLPNGKMKVFAVRHKQGERPAVAPAPDPLDEWSGNGTSETPDVSEYDDDPF